MLYRGYHIKYETKPIPTRSLDWDYWHIDYDGAPDSNDRRSGHAGSEAECRDEIDELILELGE